MAALKYSKGQIEINETILVMFFIVIIIVIGIVFYYRVFQENIKGKGEELSEQEASVMLASISKMSEISCSNEDCIDAAKLIPFSSLAKSNRDFYSGILGNKKVTIYNRYPSTNEGLCDSRKYNAFEYPENCNYWVLYDYELANSGGRGIKISTPVSLYYPESDEYRIGELEIEIYA